MHPDKKTDTARAAYRVDEFCKRLGIGPSTFWKYRGLGKIKTIKIGSRVLIPVAEALRIETEGLR